MESFAPVSFPVAVPERILGACRAVWEHLGEPGTWWTGAERLAVVEAARAAGPTPPGVPSLSGAVLSPSAHEVVRRLVAEPGGIDREWADAMVGALGPAPYVELVALVVTTLPIDRLCTLLGRPPEALPEARPGEPTRLLPDGVAQEEAYVPWQVDGWHGPNVARALSLVPADNATRMRLVRSLYADESDFGSLVWEHRALSRPQVEILAARTSAVNECFY